MTHKLPEGLARVEVGYYYDPREGKLYSLKSGQLKPLKKRRLFALKNGHLQPFGNGWTISHRGKSVQYSEERLDRGLEMQRFSFESIIPIQGN